MLEFLGLGSHRLKANPQLKEKSEDKAYANDVPFTITLALCEDRSGVKRPPSPLSSSHAPSQSLCLPLPKKHMNVHASPFVPPSSS